jgi:hypothetical protein
VRPELADASVTRAARIAAVFNAALVALIPLWLELVGRFTDPSRGHSVVAVNPDTVGALGRFAQLAPVLLVVALIAGWRTYVHSQRYLLTGARGWTAVIEPGVVGMVLTVSLLAPVVVRDPLSGSRYVAIYAVGVLVIGCVIGVLLRWTARLAIFVVNR